MFHRCLLAATIISFSVGGVAFQQMPAINPKVDDSQTPLRLASDNAQEPSNVTPRSHSRRTFCKTLSIPVVLVGATTLTTTTTNANAATPPKILVLGGTGFVGSVVVRKLNDLGVPVLATSRNGRDGTFALDVTSEGVNVENEIKSLSKGCSGVISCIGAIGTEEDATVNAATGLAAVGAKEAGVDRFVYISVAPEVKEFSEGIHLLEPYMRGKALSEESIATSFPKGSTVIGPTFIYNEDDSFILHPPRVAGFYGEFIETLFSSSAPIIQSLSNRMTHDGVLAKNTLEPPSSVESVAGAAVAGALGKTQGVLETCEAIKMAGTLV